MTRRVGALHSAAVIQNALPRGRRLWLAPAVLLGLCSQSAIRPAAAAPVHAIVYFGSSGTSSGAAAEEGASDRIGYVRLPNGVLPIASPAVDPKADALVLIDPIGPIGPLGSSGGDANALPASEAAKESAEQRLYGMRFAPAVLLVKAGTRVSLRNDDRQPVSLRCAEAPSLFPSEPLQPGAQITITAPAAETLTITSPDYPHLRGLWLSPRGVSTRLAVGDQGSVGVAKLDLPEGRYQLTLLVGSKIAFRRELAVPAKGTEFVVRLPRDGEGAAAGSEPPPAGEPRRGP